ncbi:MAG: hypothetical protein GPJ20_05890 [Microcystis aeruginosa BS13-10]|jgi:hypothetical protein|uniref:Uncharacterized protein n=1 Tax=Microcystis aeruginosa G11-04 TaxID=2685956 RepID=A0A966L4A3_MICAE|nr:hypothetical protein [Microcystis aeruginosa LE13-04]NCS38524.1 hypothetical protein [Microcystis aeruginosa BS13-10]NCS55806.1 hypothetical protein [Microcystis aeruginosa G11-04]NCT41980.1 hypothetical protein [Microcystis aeruginosa G11-09]
MNVDHQSKLYSFFFEPLSENNKSHKIYWLLISLAFVTIWIAITFNGIFSGSLNGQIYEDDVRSFAFWMYKFIDPNLFQNDFPAEVAQAVTPIGYTYLFKFLIGLGIEPLLIFQVLPIIITYVGSIFIFLAIIEILPIPFLGFICIVISLISLPLASSTPRGFAWVILPAFFYYLLRGAWIPTGITLILQGIFYPPILLIMGGILGFRLFSWENRKLVSSRQINDYLLFFIGVGAIITAACLNYFSTSKYLPIYTANEAIKMPEFWYPDGRAPYFSHNYLDTLIYGWQSGMRPNYLFEPFWLNWLSLALPILCLFPNKFPLVKLLKSGWIILPQSILSSLSLFSLANILFMKLYFPNRYTNILGIIIVFSSSITIIIISHSLYQWTIRNSVKLYPLVKWIVRGTIILGGIYILLYPIYFNPSHIKAIYHVPSIESYISQQSKNVMVASLDNIVSDNIPTFAKRSVLFSNEFNFPIYPSVYEEMAQRADSFMKVHYTDSLQELRAFIKKYNVDYLVINSSHFSVDYINRSRWFKQRKNLATFANHQLQSGKKIALANFIDKCSVLKVKSGNNVRTVIATKCILE